MRRSLALMLLVCMGAAAGSAGSQTPAPSTDAAIAVWPWLVGNIDAQTPGIIAQTQAAGLDTIYLHLWRTDAPGAGSLYMVEETGGFNPSMGTANIVPYVTLSSFISQAHAANIQVVGVVNCFLSGGPLPGDLQHQQLLLEVIDYLVGSVDLLGRARYPLDGIALDRIRYYGGASSSTPVTSFVQEIKNHIGVLPLHAFLLASLWYIDGPPYDGSFRSYAQARSLLIQDYGQDWEALSAPLDVLSPMAYVAEGGLYGSNTSLMQAYVQTAAAFAQQAITNGGHPECRVLPAVRAWNDSTGTTTAASLDASITGALLGGADGFMPFRYFTMQGQTSWWNAIAAHTNPGSDLPIADLSPTPFAGNSALLDASSSMSMTQSPATLETRFDLDDDGTADTAWSTFPYAGYLAPGQGSFPVGVEVRDAAGKIAARKARAIAIQPSLSIAPPGIFFISQGGSVTIDLDLGPAATGQIYLIGASFSGSAPGFALSPTVTLPLVPDALTDVVLDLLTTPFFPGFVGVLDSAGEAQGAVSFPPQTVPPFLAFTNMTVAAFGMDPVGGQPTTATNADSFIFFP